jgi:hypothetical protein
MQTAEAIRTKEERPAPTRGPGASRRHGRLSLVLSIGVLLAWMRVASLLPLDYGAFYVLLLVVVPLMRVRVRWLLYRVNRV